MVARLGADRLQAMAFWKRRATAENPISAPERAPSPQGRPARPSSDSAAVSSHSTTFLRGDIGEDSRSLELLLDTIARVSHSRDLESLLDFVVDSSIEATGASAASSS